jgi:hypothetical protein
MSSLHFLALKSNEIFIWYYPPKLEGVSSILNLTTRHDVVTRDPLNMGIYLTQKENVKD